VPMSKRCNLDADTNHMPPPAPSLFGLRHDAARSIVGFLAIRECRRMRAAIACSIGPRRSLPGASRLGDFAFESYVDANPRIRTKRRPGDKASLRGGGLDRRSVFQRLPWDGEAIPRPLHARMRSSLGEGCAALPAAPDVSSISCAARRFSQVLAHLQ